MRSKRCILLSLAILVVLGAALGVFAWWKFFREEPQPPFASEEEWFKHGSLGGENDQGIPYWIWIVLPRMFPDLLPGPGGYKAFGLTWEPGAELPAGFTKKVVGFPRVGNNCALCHTATWRKDEEDNPRLLLGAPAHLANVQAMLQFFSRAANDSRFNSRAMLSEIKQLTHLSFIDTQLYRFLIIPLTRKAFREQGDKFAWAYRTGKPPWGPGRDDPFNLPKYFLTSLPEDQSLGQSDFASCWNMQIRKGTNLLLNWGGETPAFYSVLVDSALGVGARPGQAFERDMARLDAFLSKLPPPAWPFPAGEHAIKQDLTARGRALYDQHCASCHEPGREKTNKILPIDDIGTDRHRLDTWSQTAADAFNQAVAARGFHRPGTIKNNGYLSPPLDGLWARAPYLHNGAVPNLRELLEPPANRSKVFYRGYDVYDPVNVGFVSSGAGAERAGFKLDTSLPGNGNAGHVYAVDLPSPDKEALIEFLKSK